MLLFFSCLFIQSELTESTVAFGFFYGCLIFGLLSSLQLFLFNKTELTFMALWVISIKLILINLLHNNLLNLHSNLINYKIIFPFFQINDFSLFTSNLFKN